MNDEFHNQVLAGAAEPTEENMKRALAMSALLTPEQRIAILIKEIKRIKAIPENEQTLENLKAAKNYSKAIDEIMSGLHRRIRRAMIKPEYKKSALIRAAVK